MTSFINDAKRLVKDRCLCLNCLGRMFAALSTGLNNRERGKIIIEMLSMDLSYRLQEGRRINRQLASSLIYWYNKEAVKQVLDEKGIDVPIKPAIEKCEICEGIFEKLNEIAKSILKEIDRYDGKSFSIGVSSLPKIEEREDRLRRKYNLKFGENIRSELSRELGKLVIKARKDLEYDPVSPDISVIINIVKKTVKISSKDLIITGILRTATKENVQMFAKVCKNCGGKGCLFCNYTGRIADRSFEYEIGTLLIDRTMANKWKFSIKYLDNGNIEFKFTLKNPKYIAVNTRELMELIINKLKDRNINIVKIEIRRKS